MTFSNIFTFGLFIFSILLLLNTFISNILLKETEKEVRAFREETRRFLQEINPEIEIKNENLCSNIR